MAKSKFAVRFKRSIAKRIVRLITKYYNDPSTEKGLLTIADAQASFAGVHARLEQTAGFVALADARIGEVERIVAYCAQQAAASDQAMSSFVDRCVALEHMLTKQQAEGDAKRQALEAKSVAYVTQNAAMKEQMATLQAERKALLDQVRGQQAEIKVLSEKLSAAQTQSTKGDEALVKERQELEFRQAAMREALLRSSSQVELIKDLLLRDGAL
ncbi:hypothetical protein [Ancylobacter sp. G4_0304]|uniref:hypothetical protein n=1 Tax=Ancylobacter sp. G4_0304 TaxID=3114289 RepID=UPI0039C68251